jgi:hypothetical protein
MTGSEHVPPPPWWKFWRKPPEIVLAIATVVLAVATIILAAIAGIQAYILATTDTSTRKAADAAAKSAATLETVLQTARENFRAEQRPVVWLSNEKGAPEFVIDKTGDNTGQILWTWHFTNYGKTPALHISFRDFMNIENTVEESYGAMGAFIGAPVPTNKDNFATVVSRPGISVDQFKRLMATDGAIGVSGEVTYYDALKNTTLRFGFKHNAVGGGSPYCKEGNEIK